MVAGSVHTDRMCHLATGRLPPKNRSVMSTNRTTEAACAALTINNRPSVHELALPLSKKRVLAHDHNREATVKVVPRFARAARSVRRIGITVSPTVGRRVAVD